MCSVYDMLSTLVWWNPSEALSSVDNVAYRLQTERAGARSMSLHTPSSIAVAAPDRADGRKS